jgi:hypothetical protein
MSSSLADQTLCPTGGDQLAAVEVLQIWKNQSRALWDLSRESIETDEQSSSATFSQDFTAQIKEDIATHLGCGFPPKRLNLIPNCHVPLPPVRIEA